MPLTASVRGGRVYGPAPEALATFHARPSVPRPAGGEPVRLNACVSPLGMREMVG